MKKIFGIIFFISTVIFCLSGCAKNYETKSALTEFKGAKEKIVLQLPDKSINRIVLIQLHRFGTKQEKVDGVKEYRLKKSVMCSRGKITVEIPSGIYDFFVDVGNKKYCLLSVNIKAGTKAIKFTSKDILQ